MISRQSRWRWIPALSYHTRGPYLWTFHWGYWVAFLGEQP